MWLIFQIMELPALLPKELAYAKKAATDLELYDLLLRNTKDLVHFFVAVAEDETWCENHEEFFNLSFTWFTNQFFLGKLELNFAKDIAEAFYSHYKVLRTSLPHNIKIKIQSKEILVNSLLLGVQSPYLNMLMIRECRDKNKKILALPPVDEKHSEFITNYLEQNKLQDLWKHEKKEIFALLEMANKIHFDPLAEECQNILKRYIAPENVLETLLLAHQKHWLILKEACVSYCNNLH